MFGKELENALLAETSHVETCSLGGNGNWSDVDPVYTTRHVLLHVIYV